MRVLVAGATGAIGRPLLEQLLAGGHEVVATTRSPERAAALRAQGIEAAVLDAFDADAVRATVAAARPEVVVHQLTALPADFTPKAMAEAGPPTNRLRRETVPVFAGAARAAGARRIVVQSISFITPPDGPPVHDEDAPLWLDCPDPGFRAAIEAVRDMEAATTGAEGIEGLVLRYGFFYGAGTWYAPDGSIARDLRRRRLPVIGDGAGLSSFVHVDDAAQATVLALDRGQTGVYNVAGPDGARWSEWVPEAARLLDAKRPRRVPRWLAKRVAGPIAAHYATTLRQQSSEKARSELGWSPRGWREGFAEVFGGA